MHIPCLFKFLISFSYTLYINKMKYNLTRVHSYRSTVKQQINYYFVIMRTMGSEDQRKLLVCPFTITLLQCDECTWQLSMVDKIRLVMRVGQEYKGRGSVILCLLLSNFDDSVTEAFHFVIVGRLVHSLLSDLTTRTFSSDQTFILSSI